MGKASEKENASVSESALTACGPPSWNQNPTHLTYDHEIRLDLRFSTKFLMGIEVGREAINRFRARGVVSGFC